MIPGQPGARMAPTNNGAMGLSRMHMAPGPNMMQQYGGYPNPGGMTPGQHMAHMHQSQMGGLQGQSAMMHQANSQMLQVQQQQNIQMSQRMSVRPPPMHCVPTSSPYSLGSSGMSVSSPVNTHQNGFPVTTTQEDFMNFLDSANTSNTDIFDSIQNSGTTDFNLLDEILGKWKHMGKFKNYKIYKNE